MTLDEFEKADGKLPLWKFLASIHRYTERVQIDVVMGDAWLKFEEAGRMREFSLTDNAFRKDGREWPELPRLLKYYADAPVWNVVARMYTSICHTEKGYHKSGQFVGTMIVAHVHYADIREGYLAEKNEHRREKRREYKQRAKERAREANGDG